MAGVDTCCACNYEFKYEPNNNETLYVVKNTLSSGTKYLCEKCKACCEICECFILKVDCIIRDCEPICKECVESGREKRVAIKCQWCENDSEEDGDGMCGECM